jgi:hypothetical protein
MSDGGAGTGGVNPAGAAGTGGSNVAGSGGSGAMAGMGGGGATGTGGGVSGTGGTGPARTIDTIAQRQALAGDVLTVVCVVSDGEAAATEIAISPADAVVRQGTDLVAAKAGPVTFTCSAPSLGLVDPTPATTTISAGPATLVRTTVDAAIIDAGDTSQVTCQGADAFGNPVDVMAIATLAVTPTGATPVGLSVTLTIAGDYMLSCQVPGTQSQAATVRVDPGLPAALVLSPSPMSAVYAAGQVVSVSYQVRDAFGNVVPGVGVDLTAVAVTGLGPIVSPSATSFRFDGDGSYEIRGAVVGPTATGMPVTAVLPVAVDGSGPAVTCTSPAMAAVITLAPGASVNLSGTAADPNGLASLVVNGATTSVDANGAFTVPVTTRYGLNHVDIQATDMFGNARRELCTFLVADRFVDEGALLSNSVMLRQAQAAIDDTSRAGSINSFADVLHAVVNSQGLKDTLHNALLAANPLKPNSCDQEVCVFGACTCVLSSQITYVSSSLPGPNTVSATLVNGGISTRARIEDPVIRLRANGSAAGVPYDTTGNVNIDFIEVDVIYDVGVDGAGRPNVTIRANSTAVRVGTISTSFSGLDGFIVNLIVGLANGVVRDIVANTIRNFIVNNFNSVLDGLVSGLDITTLAASFNVPRFAGGGNVPVSFGMGYSSVSASPTRLLFGIGTRFSAPAAHARPPMRAPLPPFDTFVDPNAAGQPMAVANHVGVYQQALQALWRGGGLDGSSPGPSAGSTIAHTLPLPPVIAIGSGSTVTLDLALDAIVIVPGALNSVHARAGARASATVTLSGDALRFTNVALDETRVAAPDVALDATAKQALVDALSPLLLAMATQTLNQVLPALPIPAFQIPSALAVYGLPAGGALGITSPTLNVVAPHFVLRGGFGVR